MSKKLSVLLIEDDIHDVEAVQRAFKTVYPPIFDLEHVPRFNDAMRLLKQKTYQVVLLDLGLSDSLGLEGAERLIKTVPEVPVIVLTGLEDEELALSAIDLGVQEFLSKNDLCGKRLVRTIRHAAKRKLLATKQLRESEAIDRRSTDPGPAKSEELENLARIIQETANAVSSHTGDLKQTELSEEQMNLVRRIETTSHSSLQQASKVLPNTFHAGHESTVPDSIVFRELADQTETQTEA